MPNINLRKYLIVSILQLLIVQGYSAITPSDSIPYGTWKVKKYVAGERAIALSSSEIKHLLNKRVVLTKVKAIFLGDTCLKPIYTIESKMADYVEDFYRIKRSDLGISQNHVRILSLDCGGEVKYFTKNSPNFSYEFIVISKKQLVVNVMGVFFFLVRVN